MTTTIVDLERFRSDELLGYDRQVDRHHLYWPRADYAPGVMRRFRSLSCTQARRFDAMVHRTYHTHAKIPQQPTLVEAKLIIERHLAGECRCNPDRVIEVVKVNLLQLPESHTLSELACVWADVDAEVYRLFMRHLGEPRLALGRQWIKSIEHRHDQGLCSCAYFAAKRAESDRLDAALDLAKVS